MLRVLSFFVLVGFSFGCSNENKKKSIALNNKAVTYWMKSNLNLTSKAYADSSLMFLSEAIKIDSLNRGAYWNKLAFENGLKRFEDAKRTAKIYFQKFHDPYALLSVGAINNQLGDSIEAKKNFKEALKYYQNDIDENKVSEDSILFQLVMAYHLNNDDLKAEELYNKYRKTRQGTVTYENVDFDSLVSLFSIQNVMNSK